MSRRRLRRVAEIGALAAWLALALSGLASGDGETFVWLALIALTPMIFVAIFVLPNVRNARTPESTLRAFASPLTAACMATSFLLLAVLVGGTLWGRPGGVVGGAVGALLAAQVVIGLRHIRRAVEPGSVRMAQQKAVRGRDAVLHVALSMAGLPLSLFVLGGFGYVLFGVAGAIVLVVFVGVSLALATAAGLRARRQRHP